MAKKTTKKCPSCKSLIDVNEKTCPFCFHQFEENANAVLLSDKNEKVNQEITNDTNFNNEESSILEKEKNIKEITNDNVLYCTVCGNKLSYNDAYCNNCGAPNKLYGTLDEKSNTSGFEKNSDGSRSFKDVSTNAPVSSRKQMDLTLMAGLGLLLSILVPIFGIIMSVSSLQASKKVYADNPTMRVRIMILSICGIVFSITFWIYSMYINFTTDDESETETALLLLSLLK